MDPALALEVAALSKQKAMNEAMSRGNSEVQRFYNNSVVFITGGSGFLGKHLIEKLLRSCQISKVFILLRFKKGKHIQERKEEILNDPVFDTLRRQKPNFSDKIIAVEGDVGEIRLGIKADDWAAITEEVNVIFHVAATTRFDETLRLATLINVRGTREVLLLGKECRKLTHKMELGIKLKLGNKPSNMNNIMVREYVNLLSFPANGVEYRIVRSCLYGIHPCDDHYDRRRSTRRVLCYSCPPEAMISMAENMDPERLINITTELIKNWPNTYTFTKAIAEDLVRTTSSGLPICIVRPGIVLSAYREPLPGWLDTSCVYGATGFVTGAALGVLHTMHAQTQIKLGLVPCDYVNNAIIVAGRETATNQAKGGNDTIIYTVSSTQRNPVTWAYIIKVVDTDGRKLQTPKSIYYSFGQATSSKLLYMFLSFFLHVIPAYIADFVSVLMGKERRFVKIAKKTYNMCNILSYFLRNEWQFVDNNLVKLYSGLSRHDKAIFNFDVSNINWAEYILIWWMGIRKYIIKDGLKDTEYGVKKQQYLKIAHYLLTVLYVYGILKLVYFLFYYCPRSLLSIIIA